MVTLYFTDGAFIYKASQEEMWNLKKIDSPGDTRCIAYDSALKRLYAGTFNEGFYCSDDEGIHWNRIGEKQLHPRVMSLYVDNKTATKETGTLWVGTEPSMLYCSHDGGESWTDYPELLNIPSEPTWSFPPRPDTHHVRTIQPDFHNNHGLFIGIELGGVMRSLDYGESWEDRKTGSHYDSHSVKVHPFKKGRIYEAAGEGFAESIDGGNTWSKKNDGLGAFTYMVDVAADPGNSETIIASVSKGPYTAYLPEKAYTHIVRRTEDSDWQLISDGLPYPEGSSVFKLMTDESKASYFYALNNTGVYVSKDAGLSFDKIEISWPEDLYKRRIHDALLIK